MFRILRRREGIYKRRSAGRGIWPISMIKRKRNEEMLFSLKILLAGIAVFGSLLGPFLWLSSRTNIDLRDFEGVPLRRIRTEITELHVVPPGRHTLVGRPRIYVRVEGQHLEAGGVSQAVYSQARVGLPVDVEYRRGRSGRLHVFRTEKWRAVEPTMVHGR